MSLSTGIVVSTTVSTSSGVLNLDVVSIVAILPVTCGRGRRSGVAARGFANGYFIGRNINYGIISPKVAEYFHCKLCNSRKNL